MSQDLPAIPWIHIGECPVCVNGLCRVRCCGDDAANRHLYAICDECEAIWTEPSTDAEKQYPDAEEPLCPICGQALYGPQSHWAKSEDLLGTPWNESAIFEVPSTDGGQDELDRSATASTEEFVTLEDIADSLDAPPHPPSRESVPALEPRPTLEPGPPQDSAMPRENPADTKGDAAYGEDEPKPGC